jgi:hypothetical protein
MFTPSPPRAPTLLGLRQALPWQAVGEGQVGGGGGEGHSTFHTALFRLTVASWLKFPHNYRK